jgi:hypothetical protein
MTMRQLLRLLALALLAIASMPLTASAQTDDWDIALLDGTTVGDADLLRVSGDTVWVSAIRDVWARDLVIDTFGIAADRIALMERAGTWNGLTGAALGLGTGGMLGLGLAAMVQVTSTSEYRGLAYAVLPAMGGLGGLVLGSVIGVLVDDDTELDLDSKSPTVRAATIAWIISSEKYSE